MNVDSVLIVDDSAADRLMLKHLITASSLSDKVFEAKNGKVATEFLLNYECNRSNNPKAFPPPLIFLDVNMPEMDGFEFLAEFNDLLDQNDYSHSAIVMFTGSEQEEDKRRALSYNFVKGYLHKMPNDLEDFQIKISQCLNIN